MLNGNKGLGSDNTAGVAHDRYALRLAKGRVGGGHGGGAASLAAIAEKGALIDKAAGKDRLAGTLADAFGPVA